MQPSTRTFASTMVEALDTRTEAPSVHSSTGRSSGLLLGMPSSTRASRPPEVSESAMEYRRPGTSATRTRVSFAVEADLILSTMSS